MDRAEYELGKRVFAGEFTPTADEENATQHAKLADLQSKLPSSVRSRVDLPELSGKLSGAQMSALRYFLEKRYKVR